SGRAPERRTRALEPSVDPVDDRLDAAGGPVDRWERLHDRVLPAAPVAWSSRPCDAPDCAEPGGDEIRIAAVLPEHVDRLHAAGADAGGQQLIPAGARVTVSRERLQLRLVRVELRPEHGQRPDDRETGERDRERPPVHEARPAAPRAVLGATLV